MKVGDLESTTQGRHYLNTWLIPRVAGLLKNGDRVLFVGTDTSWDYKPFFWNPGKQCLYETLDKNPSLGPDIVADIQECPQISDNIYTLVILIGMYEYLDKKKEAFQEINRMLVKDGYLLVAFPGKGHFSDHRGINPQETYDILKDFRILETYCIYQGREEPSSICVLCQKR